MDGHRQEFTMIKKLLILGLLLLNHNLFGQAAGDVRGLSYYTGTSTVPQNITLSGTGVITITGSAPVVTGTLTTAQISTGTSSAMFIPTSMQDRQATQSYAFQRPDFLFHTMSRLESSRQSNYSTQLRFMKIGDSFAQAPAALARGVYGDVGEDAVLTNVTLVGTGTRVITDFARWINGSYILLTGGTTSTATFLSGTSIGSVLKIAYLKDTDGGVFKVQSSQGGGAFTDEAGFTAVSGSNATPDGAVITINKTDADWYQVRIVSVSGTNRITNVWLTQKDGQQGTMMAGSPVFDAALGGTQPSDWVQCPQATMTSILGSFDPHIITVKSDDPGSTFATYWPTIYSKLQIACPNADFVIIGSHPNSGAVSPLGDQNGYDDYWRKWCYDNNALFVDCRNIMPAYTSANAALGYWLEAYPNGYHLSGVVGADYLNGIIWQYLRPVWEPFSYGYTPPVWQAWNAKLQSGLYGTMATSFTVVNNRPYTSETELSLAYAGGAGGGNVNYNRKRSVAKLLKTGTSFVARGLALWTLTDDEAFWLCDDSGKLWSSRFLFPPYAVSRGATARLEVDASAADTTEVVARLGGTAGQTGNLLEFTGTATLASSGVLYTHFDSVGGLSFDRLGTTVSIKSGTNGLAGSVTLTTGAGSIVSTAIDTNTIIETSLKTPSGTSSKPQVTVFSGSATVTGLGTDNGTYNWIGFKATP